MSQREPLYWKAYVKFYKPDRLLVQREDTVQADTIYEATEKFKQRYGNDCIIGWIRETKLYGLQSVGY